MNKKKLSHSNLNSSITSVLAALLCIVIGMAVGFLVLLAINPAHAWGDGFVRIIKGGFHDAPVRRRQGAGQRSTPHHDRSVRGLRLQDRPVPTSVLPVSTRWALTALSTAPSCSRCPGMSA